MQRNQLRTASEQLLKHWQRSGISQIPSNTPQSDATTAAWLNLNAPILFDETELAIEPDSPSRVVSTMATIVKEPEPITQSNLAVAKWETNVLPTPDRTNFFSELNDQVTACRKCEDIVCRRQRTVFGVGSLNARVVMFGEAPGADEDRVGEPFVGAAGQLLDKILVACGLNRSEVYILNALKCRPPNNRTPTEIEIENCRPYFESQLETLQPEYIVCWGSVAVRAVLRSTESVGRLRGKFHAFRGAKVMVTYHPAYLLRNPDAKRLTWDDMKLLIKDMGLQIPGKSE